MGRPRLDIDAVQVRKLARMGASNVDIADFFGCDEGTIRRRFSENLTKGRAERKLALRAWQWRAAEAGNVAMLIWLGKQELGQSDRVEARHEVGPLVDRHAQRRMLSSPQGGRTGVRPGRGAEPAWSCVATGIAAKAIGRMMGESVQRAGRQRIGVATTPPTPSRTGGEPWRPTGRRDSLINRERTGGSATGSRPWRRGSGPASRATPPAARSGRRSANASPTCSTARSWRAGRCPTGCAWPTCSPW